MCHSGLFAFLAGVFAMKLLFRWRFGRHGGCGGGWRGRHGGFGRHGFPGGRGRGFRGVGERIMEVMQGLDLNQRQREEAHEVFDRVRASVRDDRGAAQRLDEVLDAVGGTSFDRARVESAFGLSAETRKELVDGLEHLHNILTEEQRLRLRELLHGPAPASPTPPPPPASTL